ncbi:MAG: hypothetical protein Q9216_006372 [Gyalolechia sp. 2 TL-2023]
MHDFRERCIKHEQAVAREQLVPEAQREEARRLRQTEEVTAMSQRAMKASRERQEREEKREREAITSQKMDISMVMAAALGVLQSDGDITPARQTDNNNNNNNAKGEEEEDTCQIAVQRLLVGIYKVTAGIDFHDSEWALDACRMLERWRDWNARGGMNRDDLYAITKDRKAFCWAAVAVGLITRVCEKERADGGGLWGDVRECLRVWKKVRLG